MPGFSQSCIMAMSYITGNSAPAYVARSAMLYLMQMQLDNKPTGPETFLLQFAVLQHMQRLKAL